LPAEQKEEYDAFIEKVQKMTPQEIAQAGTRMQKTPDLYNIIQMILKKVVRDFAGGREAKNFLNYVSTLKILIGKYGVVYVFND
jgi:hypothetical protein